MRSLLFRLPGNFWRMFAVTMLGVVCLSGANCGSSSETSASPPTEAPITYSASTPPSCGGGPGVAASSMSGGEVTLYNLFVTRNAGFVPAITSSVAVNVGVAQWHARDMATNNTVAIVGSDGEDPLRRIVCSGGTTAKNSRVIAVGYSTDASAVFTAIQENFNANQFTFGWTTLSVGYSKGYWLLIFQ